MTLPRSFKSWAAVGGKVAGILVETARHDLGQLEVGAVYIVRPEACSAVGECEHVPESADARESARAWAVKALAWLKAESEKATKEDLYIRAVGQHIAHLRSALEELARFGVRKDRTELMSAAAGAYTAVGDSIPDNLRTARMTDLVDRCAEEMRRQAEEVVGKASFCAECLGPVVGASIHPHCASEKVKP